MNTLSLITLFIFLPHDRLHHILSVDRNRSNMFHIQRFTGRPYVQRIFHMLRRSHLLPDVVFVLHLL